MSFRWAAAAAVGVMVVPAVASAQVLMQRDVSLRMALTIAEAALAECGTTTSVAIVDRAGRLRVFLQGDNANPHNIELARRKAYTARTFRSPSGALVERLKADPTLGLIHLTNVIANQGALPIKVGDEVIGAAGASGAPGGEKDEACVKAGIDKVADLLK